MNINNVRKLFGDMSSQEVRTLELRVGQVVRGVVTQQLPNQEALVNINGVQVKAKLEIPILEGQATLMQVAPDSKGSYIHLKQVDPATVGLHDPMKDILKSMNLPDKEWSNHLVRELRQEGFPLNRETLQALAQAVKEKPPHVDLEGWMQAASQAFKRGMPMTAASISAMQQLSQGIPLHQLVSQLQQQLTQLLQTQGQQISTQTSHLLQQLTQSLAAQGQALQISEAQSQVQQSTQAQQNTQTQVSQTQVNQTLANHAQANQTLLAQAQNPIASFLKLLGVQHENMLSQQLYKGEQTQGQSLAAQAQASQAKPGQTPNQPNLSSQQANQLMQQQGGTGLSSNATQSLGTPSGALQTAAMPSQAQANGQSAATQVNQSLTQTGGIALHSTPAAVNQTQHSTGQMTSPNGSIQNGASIVNQQASLTSERTTTNQQQSGLQAQVQATATTQAQPTTLQAALTVTVGQSGVQTMLQNQAEPIINTQLNQGLNNSQATDSIKATVLGLLQMNDVPVAMKESLTQLLNHITGQQMMLATERNHSMFTHITMYIPIKDDQGGQTAAVHVQTRRDRKGQLDAENCRIVFDLNMKQIGQTLVDMNVTNKIVSLNVWNDRSFIQNLLDTMRPDIYDALQKTGYSLSSIKATPFKKEEQLDEVKAIIQPPALQQMNSARYKGVDFKV